VFIDVATFGSGAVACAEHLSEGRQVAATGRLAYRKWVNKEGKRRSAHSVIGRVPMTTYGSRRTKSRIGKITP